MPVLRLDTKSLDFPSALNANADGLVAVGGDLSTARLIRAYRSGIFPWTVNPVTWWSPDPRGIIPLDALHVSRSLRRTVRKNIFAITVDTAFEAVMRECARPAPGREETWITREFIEAYTKLHREGHAHSLECWQGTRLVGGIYGVVAGGLFAGESMFHIEPDASKIALFHLVERLKARKFVLFDIQMLTAVTRQMGGTELSRKDYLARLSAALAISPTF
jgi:leucyl/phenylalanyl-tRNA--protein transferase